MKAPGLAHASVRAYKSLVRLRCKAKPNTRSFTKQLEKHESSKLSFTGTYPGPQAPLKRQVSSSKFFQERFVIHESILQCHGAFFVQLLDHQAGGPSCDSGEIGVAATSTFSGRPISKNNYHRRSWHPHAIPASPIEPQDSPAKRRSAVIQEMGTSRN